MTNNLPYSFVPGTKARAQEVNANFLAVMENLDSKANKDFSNLSSSALDAIKNNTPSRNIGEIFCSIIPLTDSGVHLLDGTRLENNGIYTNFISYIADIYGNATEHPSYFCTEDEWQESVTKYGVCAKFVYDNTTKTVRLPKITGIIEGTTDVNTLGDLVEAGLPNHYHFAFRNEQLGGNGGDMTMSADRYPAQKFYSNSWWNTVLGSTSNVADVGRTSDAKYSTTNITETSTVQPQTIKAFYYIVLATSSKNSVTVQIDNIAADLNNKIDKDGTNAEFAHITESYVNGSSWYNIYSNGFCEQGGNCTSGTAITLLKAYKDTNYTLSTSRSAKSNTGFTPSQTGEYITKGYIR